MIAAGYRIFTDGCVVASFLEVIVAAITEETSGAGNGTNCSQLNIVISLVEAIYLFESMWLFLFFELKPNFFISPHAFERGLSLAERNTLIAQNFVLYSVYFALAGGYYAGKVGAFVNGCLCIHSHYAIEGR